MGEFRTSPAREGSVVLEGIARSALDLALETARRCRWNDVGVDICL